MNISNFKPVTKPTTVGAPSGSSGGFLSSAAKFAGNVAMGGLGFLQNVGTGIGSEVGQLGIGLGEAATKGVGALAGAVGLPGVKKGAEKVASEEEKLKQGIFVQPFQGQNKGALFGAPNLNSVGGAVGKGTADIAALAEAPVAKAQEALTGLKDASTLAKGLAKIPGLDWVATKVLRALPEAAAGGAFGLASSGGNLKEAGKSAATFGTLSALGGTLGDVLGKFKGSLEDNVAKGLGVSGRMGLKEATEKIGKSTQALTTLANLAPEIKVTDAAGVEKTFNPLKATFNEMTQAVYKGKQMLYDTYDQLAKKAGDAGVQFTQKDHDKVLGTLDDIINGDTTSSFKNKAKQIKQDIIDNFGTVDPKDPTKVTFQPTDLKRVQTYLEALNTDVDNLTQKAGAKVTGDVTRKIREVLDDKITNATGEGYQNLRTQYSNLKSIEDDVLNQWKKAMRKMPGGAPDIIEGFGTLDAIMGAAHGGAFGAAKGLGEIALGQTLKYLRDPEAQLQSAFEKIIAPKGLEATNPMAAVNQRAFGDAGIPKGAAIPAIGAAAGAAGSVDRRQKHGNISKFKPVGAPTQ